MSEQQSRKRGVKSEAQKRQTSHREYDPMPASGPAGGAFGKHNPHRQSDQNAALHGDGGRAAQRRKQWSERERSEDV
jgi:hypothetical protein